MIVLFVFFSFVWGQPFTIIGYIGSTLNIFSRGKTKACQVFISRPMGETSKSAAPPGVK